MSIHIFLLTRNKLIPSPLSDHFQFTSRKSSFLLLTLNHRNLEQQFSKNLYPYFRLSYLNQKGSKLPQIKALKEKKNRNNTQTSYKRNGKKCSHLFLPISLYIDVHCGKRACNNKTIILHKHKCLLFAYVK